MKQKTSQTVPFVLFMITGSFLCGLPNAALAADNGKTQVKKVQTKK
jgi:hypothetical protein